MNPFSFRGRLARIPYLFWSLAIFLSQHLFVLATYKIRGLPLVFDGWFAILPLRALVANPVSPAALVFGLALLLIVSWALCALTFRRASDANVSEWTALAAVIPAGQLLVTAILAFVPSRVVAEGTPPAASNEPQPDWLTVLQALAAGTIATLFAVALGSLGFGGYGAIMFLFSPFFIGAVTAYVANRDEDLGRSGTSRIVIGATVLGGMALVLTALEGLICIVLTGPLAIGIAVAGGFLGRQIALSRRQPTKQVLSGFALLPIAYALELFLPGVTHFDTLQTIQVDAPPEVVWQSILRMETIEEPLSLPYRLGVAHPVRGEVIGEGVGAARRGEFSTGTAIERVTEWIPNQKLAFVVVDDIPAMHEVSPYPDLHTPHLVGYFRTTTTSFELSPQPGGRTEITERTSHQLKLDPILYWLPLAQWMVGQNNARVLAHIKRQAERSISAGG